MTRPTEIRHPSLAEFSIDEMWLNRNPRRLGLSVLNDEKGEMWENIRFEPSIRPRTQIFPKPPSPLTNPKIPSTYDYLLKKVIQHLKGIEDPPKETMQIWGNPPVPGLKGRDRTTTRTMTTYSLPVT